MPIPGPVTPPVSVSADDFATYLNNPSAADDPRASYILTLATNLCLSVVSPLPAGAEVVILDVAERAYANPGAVAGSGAPSYYAEGEGPFSENAPGYSGGGLYLTESNKATLRRLSGGGGAFTIDLTPVAAGQNLPPWDVGNWSYW